MRILAIETSCDETAAAIVEDGITIHRSVIASSATMHQKYGGIVPEVAARAQLESILPVLTETLSMPDSSTIHDLRSTISQSIDAIAVTVGPGLIGSLLVGIETAKTLAFVTGKPIIPVNHVLAHMYANFIQDSTIRDLRSTITFPAISLVVSGGHTELFLMKDEKTITWLGGTVDDAAGEAFDKTARLLGFGNGGGPAIQQAAQQSTVHDLRSMISLPRPLMHDKTLNFSFSGLKTAVMRGWKQYHPEPASVIPANPPTGGGNLVLKLDPQVLPEDDNPELVAAFAYEIQEAITDVLVAKTLNAAKLHNAKSILASGGVAANTRLRQKFQSTINDLSSTISFFVPPIALCTDNAAYIASYAFFRGKKTDWHDITAVPDLSVEITE